MRAYQQIQSCFERMGARVSIEDLGRNMPNRRQLALAIDIVQDSRGECFDIRLAPSVRLRVLDLQPRSRHLLLAAANDLGEDRFLCGHDELHWFAAGLPRAPDRDEPGPATVVAARESLKPGRVTRRERARRSGKRPRRSDLFLRQGEWFFLPCPHAGVNLERVVRNGSLVRGPGSKPHLCEFLYEDGEREYQCDRYPKLAFFESEYQEILRTRRKAKQWNWRPLPYEPDVFVRGWITHPDHSPLFLDIWHRVELNREIHQQLTMTKMVYRD
jgi:hypothetical protein